MNRLRLVLLMAVCGGIRAVAETPAEPDKTLQALLAGNQRFVAANFARPNQTTARRMEVAQGQHPVAAVLACSDSRVPPELLFDQGLGDLFVIRLAGNIPDDAALGSLEYAAEHLGVHLAVVLGHKRCGAVDAAVKSDHAPGHIQALVDAILPAVAASKGMPGDAVDNAVRANVSQVSARLRAAAPILSEMVHEHHLKVVGAYYDLDNGKVTVLP